jgi:hypothetical protein
VFVAELLVLSMFVEVLTDDGEVDSLMRQAPFTPRKIPGTHFC